MSRARLEHAAARPKGVPRTRYARERRPGVLRRAGGQPGSRHTRTPTHPNTPADEAKQTPDSCGVCARLLLAGTATHVGGAVSRGGSSVDLKSTPPWDGVLLRLEHCTGLNAQSIEEFCRRRKIRIEAAVLTSNGAAAQQKEVTRWFARGTMC